LTVATLQQSAAGFGPSGPRHFSPNGSNQLNAASRIGTLVLSSAPMTGTAFAAEGDHNLAERASIK